MVKQVPVQHDNPSIFLSLSWAVDWFDLGTRGREGTGVGQMADRAAWSREYGLGDDGGQGRDGGDLISPLLRGRGGDRDRDGYGRWESWEWTCFHISMVYPTCYIL